MQLSGVDSGASAICAISVAALSETDRAPCGTKPPTTTAARIATSPRRHFMRMVFRLRAADKGQV